MDQVVLDQKILNQEVLNQGILDEEVLNQGVLDHVVLRRTGAGRWMITDEDLLNVEELKSNFLHKKDWNKRFWIKRS